MLRKSLFELASCEGHRFGSFCIRGPIRLVYGDNEILHVPRDCLNQYKLFAG
jgi:hypothetical protein